MVKRCRLTQDALRALMLTQGTSDYGLGLDFAVLAAVTAGLISITASRYRRMGYWIMPVPLAASTFWTLNSATRSLVAHDEPHLKENTAMSRNCRKGLDDRCRDSDGEIRRKNGATRVGSLRQTYGESFAPGTRTDMKLETLLERSGANSLSAFLRKRELGLLRNAYPVVAMWARDGDVVLRRWVRGIGYAETTVPERWLNTNIRAGP
jgi:hypothetical protein